MHACLCNVNAASARPNYWWNSILCISQLLLVPVLYLPTQVVLSTENSANACAGGYGALLRTDLIVWR